MPTVAIANLFVFQRRGFGGFAAIAHIRICVARFGEL
jgi:hypothetical protein